MSGVTPNHELDDADLQELRSSVDDIDTAEPDQDDAEIVDLQRPALEKVVLRLRRDNVALLRKRAEQSGVTVDTLINMILHHHLKNPLLR